MRYLTVKIRQRVWLHRRRALGSATESGASARYGKAPDGRTLIDVEGYEAWVEMGGSQAVSDSSIEITFMYRGVRCRERISLKPTATNLKRAEQHKAAIEHAIAAGTFDYSVTFPGFRARQVCA